MSVLWVAWTNGTAFMSDMDSTQMTVSVNLPDDATLEETGALTGSSLHGLHDGRHFSRDLPQGIQFPAPHLYGDTAAAHGAHIHTGGIHRETVSVNLPDDATLEETGALTDTVVERILELEDITDVGAMASTSSMAMLTGGGNSSTHSTDIYVVAPAPAPGSYILAHRPTVSHSPLSSL